MRIRVATFAFSLCLAACTGAPAPAPGDGAGHPPVPVGEEFTLAVGDSARIGETDLVILFDAVAEDSRCATNVTCVWEGNARARFTVREYSAMSQRTVEVLDDAFELNTSGRFTQRRRTPVGDLVLRHIDPQPPIDDPAKYIAVLIIEPKT